MHDLDLRISVYKPISGGHGRVLLDLPVEQVDVVHSLWGQNFNLRLNFIGNVLHGSIVPSAEPARQLGPKAFGQHNIVARRQISWGSHYFDGALWDQLSTYKLQSIDNITYDDRGIHFVVPDIHDSPASIRTGCGGHGINKHNSPNKPEPTPEAPSVLVDEQATLTETTSLDQIKLVKDTLEKLIEAHNTTKGFKSQLKMTVKKYTTNVELL